ncbi:MAG TPA: methane monooxygenase/ammonia monooxygenase subunit C [Thermoplasmata archaeon]|nr:methane monooxygenase/ammonia monooxygenase subunit C [Thermoplasmata archaeon]
MAYATANEKPVLSVAGEGRALRNLMWMWWITAVTYNAVAIPVIWDPAQHSFLVRDSTWTPPHLMIFGPFFALMMFEAIVFQFYALKKAQPYIRGEIPITLWVFPITVFGFTLGSMLTNEIGHIFLFREEFFSMPTHWNFVLTFMFIYAVGVPEVVRVLVRLGQLEARAKDLVAAEAPAPVSVPARAPAGRPAMARR